MSESRPSVWERIEEARRRHDVLEHPFYERWSAGELSADELSHYAGQYRHAVEAIATVSERLAEQLPEHPELAGHAQEEREHIALWDGFVDAVGGSSEAEPTPETGDCVGVWTEDGDALAALARLYAIENAQPAISETKLEGLREHYGITSEDGTRYFTVHRGRDVEHAAEGRELLGGLIASEADADRAVAAAEAAYEANWRLLDGVS